MRIYLVVGASEFPAIPSFGRPVVWSAVPASKLPATIKRLYDHVRWTIQSDGLSQFVCVCVCGSAQQKHSVQTTRERNEWRMKKKNELKQMYAK